MIVSWEAILANHQNCDGQAKTELFLLKEIQFSFVDLKSNSALLNNKGHNFWKSVLTWKIPQNWLLP